MIKIYGIKNCDTMKRAMKYLDSQGVDYIFHDYRKDGVDEDLIRRWVMEYGLDVVLNKKGTTWRKLPESVKGSLDTQGAIKLLCENEAMIKRPVFELGDKCIIGFSKNEQNLLEEALLK
ncbi:MAG: arsenate reductase [Alphaproteobacteria bacterium]|nr:arsenate reductase [Alphaproteobacteria bacterium]HPF45431.1 arsenate reductase [Emcibacteraceae bacterium]HRW29577.1 arsenate reductase [Emcibacteraceae bacterium]